MKRIIGLICLVVLATAAGCQTLAKNGKPVETKFSSAAAPAKPKTSLNPLAGLTGKEKLPIGNPDKIVAIWKDATYTVAGQRPTRGFGGRLYFHDRNDQPVVVDGDLIVYGFKDEKHKLDQKPEKRFVFKREDLQKHMSVSTVGPSYNVWLPYDHINGDQKELVLLAVFKDAQARGRICSSEQIPTILPGRKPHLAQARDELLEEIRKQEEIRSSRAIGFEQTKPEGTKKIKSTEIIVPAASKDRLFGTVPTTSYRLPEPKITEPKSNVSGVAQASAIEPITNSGASQPSTNSSPDPRQVRSGRFVRQGKLPPWSKPPRLGVKSSAEARR